MNQGYEPTTPLPPPEQPKKSNNTLMIVIVVIAVIYFMNYLVMNSLIQVGLNLKMKGGL